MRCSLPSLTRSTAVGPEYRRLSNQEDSENANNVRNDQNSDNVFDELPVKTRLRALQRRLLAYSAAVVLIFLVIVLIVSMRTRTRLGTGFEDPDDDEPMWDNDSEYIANDPRLEKFQTPSHTSYCVPWTSNNYDSISGSTTQVSFKISAQSDLIFFVSRGRPTKGHFTVNSDRFTRLEAINVNVTAQYNNLKDLEHTKACFVESNNEGGIMIWAEDHDSSSLPIFNISVEIPWSNFRDLSTDFSGGKYTQTLGDFFDIWNPIGFGTVRLKGREMGINSLGMFAESTFIRTTNAAVSASSFSSDAVHIRTTNAPIDAMVWALGQREGAITEVSMRTSNAHIQAALTLASDFNAVKLNASLHTSNGALNISMPRMPVLSPDYVLVVDGSTSNAASNVYLSPDYTGTFDLRTDNNGKAHVQWDPEMRDPSGKGRKHVLKMDSDIDEHKSGMVYWGDEAPTVAGDIKVKTTKEDVWFYT